jgi:hypothetical protein
METSRQKNTLTLQDVTGFTDSQARVPQRSRTPNLQIRGLSSCCIRAAIPDPSTPHHDSNVGTNWTARALLSRSRDGLSCMVVRSGNTPGSGGRDLPQMDSRSWGS